MQRGHWLGVLLAVGACDSSSSPDAFQAVDHGQVLDAMQPDGGPGDAVLPDGAVDAKGEGAPSDGTAVDGPVSADSVPQDLSPKTDAHVWPDGSSGSLSCDGIMQCAYSCSTQACLNQCLQQGTVSAQQQFLALDSCMYSAAAGSCASDCANPMTTACQVCLSQACSAEITACLGTTVWPDGGPLPADGGPSQDWGTGLSCADVLQCQSSCADQACVTACMLKGSPTAQSAYKLLMSCLSSAYSGSCASDCASPSSPTCDQCLNTACSAEINACLGP